MPAREPVGLVIFDCDGVLVESEILAVRIQVQIGAELGWPLTRDDVLDLFLGRSAVSVTEHIVARIGEDAAVRWRHRFETLHGDAVQAELIAVPGIEDAIAAIAAADLPMCVASSNGHRHIREMLVRTGLYEHFEGRIYSATEVAHGKPAPDVFLHAAAKMGFDPEVCAVVEDSRFGVQAARAAGMRSFGYFGGITPREWLEGPDTVVFDDMRRLPELIAAV